MPPHSQLLRHSWGGGRRQFCLQVSRQLRCAATEASAPQAAPFLLEEDGVFSQRKPRRGSQLLRTTPAHPTRLTVPPVPWEHGGCAGDRAAGRAQRARWWDKVLATDCVTARAAVSSSNTAWGTACSRDHSTNSFITQHMFSFIKQNKTKKGKQKLYFFCNEESDRAIETESRREISRGVTNGNVEEWKPGTAWPFLPQSWGPGRLEKALSCAADSCLPGATSSSSSALGGGPSPSRNGLTAMSHRIFSQAMT